MSSEFRHFVIHPRYGQRPRITGINPIEDYTTVHLHWRAQEDVRIPYTAIPADLSKQSPATFQVTHYFDERRHCVDCRKPFLFFAAEQKYWYEDLGFSLDWDCVRCVFCRRTHRGRGVQRMRKRYETLVHVQERTDEQNLEMLECWLSLVELRVFGRRQIGRMSDILKVVPPGSTARALRERLHALGGPV